MQTSRLCVCPSLSPSLVADAVPDVTLSGGELSTCHVNLIPRSALLPPGRVYERYTPSSLCVTRYAGGGGGGGGASDDDPVPTQPEWRKSMTTMATPRGGLSMSSSLAPLTERSSVLHKRVPSPGGSSPRDPRPSLPPPGRRVVHSHCFPFLPDRAEQLQLQGRSVRDGSGWK